MITSNVFKVVSIGIALLFTQACSHPIEIVGQGDVTSASGNRNCYLEDFQQAKVNCTKNNVFGAYQETYYAVPRAGWKFDHWVNYCANATPPSFNCSFNTPAAAVSQFWGQTMPPLKAVFTTCTPGTAGCGWHTGDVVTHSQGNYGADPANNMAAAILSTQYANVFGVIFEVGLPSNSGNSIVFTSAGALLAYLPASVGAPAALNQDLLNPTDSSSNVFGGEVAGLKLNIDFSAAGKLGGTSGLSFGALTLCNTPDTSPSGTTVNGTTVSGLLVIANLLLGGGSSRHNLAAINEIVEDLNASFSGGMPSTFAQASLFNGACP